VKQEWLDWVADNPLYTKRFAFHIGRRCRHSSIRDVAKEHLLDWKTVKALEMQYMREQIKRAGQPRPKVIGIDEISIRKGQTYRIVVSDLDRRRAIWFGGKDRSEESMDMFFAFLGERSSKRVRLASRSASRRTRRLPRLPFCSISSTSCVIWETRSTR
jgi:transposase